MLSRSIRADGPSPRRSTGSSSERAEISFDGESVLVVDDLKREVAAGGVGVTASDLAPAHFSGFAYAEDDSPFSTPARPPEPVDERAIRVWDVSDVVEDAAELALDGRTWTRLEAEPSGLTDLARE